MLPKELQDKWNEAGRTGELVHIGDLVVCDSCDKDFTELPDSGGFIFGSSAYCPECAKRILPNIQRYGEEKYIKAACPEGQSFADFVRQYRGADAGIKITEFKKA